MKWRKKTAAGILSLGLASLGLTSLLGGRPQGRLPAAEYRWEYAMPDHLPKETRYPQHPMTGRKYRIIPVVGESENVEEATLHFADGKQQTITTSKRNKGSFTVDVPFDPEAKDDITINFSNANGHYAVTLPVSTGAKALARAHIPVTGDPIGIPVQMRPNPNSRRLNAPNWETVIAQDPANSDRGAVIGLNITTTIDGWNTWTVSDISALTQQPAKAYYCDPRTAFDAKGRMVLSGLTQGSADYPYINAALWIANWNGAVPSLEQILLDQQPPILPQQSPVTQYGMLADYTKLAIDTNPNSPWFDTAYVSANAMYFPGYTFPTGIFVVRHLSDATKRTIAKLNGGDIGIPQPPNSGVVMNGVVHFGRDMYFDGTYTKTPAGVAPGTYMVDYVSLDGGASFAPRVIAPVQRTTIARVSTASNRGIIAYRGLELIADEQRNVLYALWSDSKNVVTDKDFEYGEYGDDFDVYCSRSFDNGGSWSSPVRVNDDAGVGNQWSASGAVDENGTLYVAFYDHRYNLDKATFDIYLAASENLGASFGKNYRVNDFANPNEVGGRGVGDYFVMVAPSLDKITVGHPCVDIAKPQYGNPNSVCVTTIDKYRLPYR